MGEAPPPKAAIGPWVAPVAGAPTLLAPDVFKLLNVERRCAAAQDWRRGDVTKLWLYHLHYFDDLNARDAPSRRAWHEAILDRWVAENPPGEGPGWEPYPVSRRIVNWVKWALAGNVLPANCQQSLAAQARWLMRRLEYHLLGNHLFANGKALVHAGSYFGGPEGETWYRRGRKIIEGELQEQILADGGHFERSPMYHAAAVEDLLDLINIQRAFGHPVQANCVDAQQRMREWQQIMCHPDGGISFFNDAAFGMAPELAELKRYAGRLSLAAARPGRRPLEVLEASGYCRIVRGPAYVICDCAPLGPDYLLGHGHADTLSFEMSLGRDRLFVNSGTSLYGVDGERHRQRGTAAHNTLAIDEQDSSEVWSGFRVARRARAQILAASSSAGHTVVEGIHDGYARLPGKNLHTRRWVLDDRSLHVEDRISGHFRVADAYFHLHPEVTARLETDDCLSLSWPGHQSIRMRFEGARRIEIRPGTWHPEFGVTLPNQCIAARLDGSFLVTRLEWGEAS
jgi:uncharacterized heparinase superfamily protein